MPNKMKVGLLFGGRSGEHEVSIASALSVYNALDKTRYDVTLIAIDKDGRWLIPDAKPILAQADEPMKVKINVSSAAFSLVPYPNVQQLVPLSAGSEKVPRFDVILPILHGTYGEDGTIQGLLELAQIPYVGSGVLGSAIGMDKDVANRLMLQAGIPVVPSLCVRHFELKVDEAGVLNKIQKEFAYPLFVKPANAGSSVGVSKVKSKEQLLPALEEAFSFDTKVMVQKAVNARELECSVLGNANPRASIVGEIVPNHEFYSYEAKYLDDKGADLQIPAKNLSQELSHKIRDLAVKVFGVLELRGMARVDFFLDRQTGELFLNEVNTIPGFTSISMYPKMWEAAGLPYPKLLDELIQLAIESFEERRSLKTSYTK